MCLLSTGLDTLGLLLRIWLWISVPMAVIILLVASWMNYVRNVRPKSGLSLAVEGVGGDISPGSGALFIGRDEVVGEGEVLQEKGGGTFAGGGRGSVIGGGGGSVTVGAGGSVIGGGDEAGSGELESIPDLGK